MFVREAPTSLKVVVAGPEEFTRAGLCQFLAERLEVVVVGEAADNDHTLDVVAREDVDLVVSDLGLGPMSDEEFTARLRRIRPEGPPMVLFLGRDCTSEQVLVALAAKADGVVAISTAHIELSSAIHSILDGHVYLSPCYVTRLLSDFVLLPVAVDQVDLAEYPELTDREMAVLDLIAEGLNNEEIAKRLHLAETTVKTYSSHLFEKLGVRDRLQAGLLAIQTGLSKPARHQPPLWHRGDQVAGEAAASS
jgi:DNA-binding NarL/FixJ family response regulator